MNDCVKTQFCSGPCSICGRDMDPAHVYERDKLTDVFCGACCPVHRAPSDWQHKPGTMPTVSGEQKGLFD